jgi:uncharacterized protein (TIGR03067 family)
MRALLLSGAALLLVAAGTKEDQAQSELKRFAGNWVLDAGEMDGKKLSDEQIHKSKIRGKGNRVILRTPHQSKKAIKARITLDPTKTPREMDFVRSAGPHKGQKLSAIYEFLGEDRYRICFDPHGKTRPKEFSTKEGTGHILHVWRRAKK